MMANPITLIPGACYRVTNNPAACFATVRGRRVRFTGRYAPPRFNGGRLAVVEDLDTGQEFAVRPSSLIALDREVAA